MIRILVFLFFLSLPSLTAFAGESPSVVGHWQFYMKVFQGTEMPEPPSASLRLHFEFSADGESRLYWWHEGAGDHCSRKGRYYLEGDFLVDEVTWVDPANTRDCADDLDMHLGRKTSTPYFFRGADLAIRFHLDGEPLDMVWKRIETEGK